MRKFEMVKDKFIDFSEDLTFVFPHRSTDHSAGYDFFAPKTYVIGPGESAIIPTYFKAYMKYYSLHHVVLLDIITICRLNLLSELLMQTM